MGCRGKAGQEMHRPDFALHDRAIHEVRKGTTYEMPKEVGLAIHDPMAHISNRAITEDSLLTEDQASHCSNISSGSRGMT